MKRNGNYLLFVVLLYLIVFREALEDILSIFGYLDEAIACFALPIAVKNLSVNRWELKIRKISRQSCAFWLTISILFALLGNMMYKYQNFFSAVLPDLILYLKFWLSIYVGYNLFKKLDFSLFSKRIIKHLKFVVWLYIVLLGLDFLFELFPGDVRYGLKSTQLFYGLHTTFCAMCVTLLALFTLFKAKVRNYKFYSCTLLLLIASTLRSKAFGAVGLYILLYYLIEKLNKKVKLRNIILIAVLCLIIGWSQIQYYFFSSISDGAARNVLLQKCFNVASDHFPLGAGLATFASHYSGVEYSPLYSIYGISNIYGLTKEHYTFISDSFWPMEIAQNGYLGTICFITALYMLFKRIQVLKGINKNVYFGTLFAMGYLCISSLAESAFVHPISVPLGLVIGIGLSRKPYGKILFHNKAETEGNLP